MAVSDYSTTPGSNTSISGINIGEGCAPSNVNNAIRQLMTDVKGYTATVVPFSPPAGWVSTMARAAIIEAYTKAVAAIPGAATTTASGLMPAAAMVKLNGIATGAQVNPSIATKAEAEAGTNTTKMMTPQRTEEHMLFHAFGWGQLWSDMTGFRTPNTTYRNTTGRPIEVSITGPGRHGRLLVNLPSTSTATLRIQGTGSGNQDFSDNTVLRATIPNGDYYRVEGMEIINWSELR